MGKSEEKKANDSNKTICAKIDTTNGFTLNHDKTLQMYFCVKRLAINDFLKDFESAIGTRTDGLSLFTGICV